MTIDRVVSQSSSICLSVRLFVGFSGLLWVFLLTHKHLGLVMALLCSKLAVVGQTVQKGESLHTDGRYQVHYLP